MSLPRITFAAAGDFQLQPGSPAINRGQSLGPQVDFAGTKVPYGAAPDLGALEVVIGGKVVNALGTGAQAVRITLAGAVARRLRRAAHIPVTLRLEVEVTTADGRATRVRRSIRLLAN